MKKIVSITITAIVLSSAISTAHAWKNPFSIIRFFHDKVDVPSTSAKEARDIHYLRVQHRCEVLSARASSAMDYYINCPTRFDSDFENYMKVRKFIKKQRERLSR